MAMAKQEAFEAKIDIRRERDGSGPPGKTTPGGNNVIG